MMKRLIFASIVLAMLMIFLPLSANASMVLADGVGRSGSKARVKKTAKVSVAKSAAIAAAARERSARAAEAQRLRHLYEKQRLDRDQELANLQQQDPFIRQAALASLAGRTGTVLITDVRNNQIVASVYQDWANYKEFHPCSTIKLPTALAGLRKNVIDSNGLIVDTNKKSLEKLTLDDALKSSNNHYFNEIGAKVGGSEFLDVSKKTGLGRKTEFKVPGQSAGKLPDSVVRSDEYSHAYNVRVTALQLNALALGIANSRTQDAFGIPKEHLQRLIPGMIMAAETGTAKLSKSIENGLRLAGKTGTCQNTGLFTGFVPHDNPRYAITVIIHGKGKHAAQVAGLALKPLMDRSMLGVQANHTASLLQ
jgi:cell division protein FtsI/penicillin-binding protein 2